MPRSKRRYSYYKADLRRYRRRRFIALLLVLAVVGAVGLLWHFESPQLPDAQQTIAPQPEDEKPQPNISAELSGTAALTDLWIYGTHLSLEGELPFAVELQPQSTELVLYGTEGELQSWPLQMMSAEGTVRFYNADKLNTGLELEALAEAEGWLLLRLHAADAQGQPVSAEYTLQPGEQPAKDLPFTYYTVTKNGANRCITLEAKPMILSDGTQQTGVYLRCAAAQLPADVYDIVIDPGHGGTDAGSLSTDMRHYEADIVLDVAKRAKTALEALGYKVLLTRDGTEDPTTKMAYTMYDEDGRVTLAAGSGAKLCLSIHLNSYDGYMADDQGGVQVYAADHMDYAFAQQLAQSVAQHAGSRVSTMASYKVMDGVFCRVFTPGDSAELAAEGYEHNFTPYNIPAGTNYYYIIRETGGRITGAYIDGRHPHYGENIYRDSAVGVESYLCEIGYITLNSELKNLLANPQGYADGLAAAVDARFGG